MQLPRTFSLFGCCFLVSTLVTVAGQNEPIFELPVQLIGFPIIIASVRITNFLKKLAYALNPDTYVSRVKRAHPLIHEEEILDVDQVEKKLVAELGNNVCIYERICVKYAEQTLQRRSWERVLNWNEIFREYKSSSDPMKENYLLSVFMGDIIGSPKLCHLLAKRGRACDINATTSD
ncbi:uncharacterized protein LOC105830233 [Monomorium pharaonis]|uniref:uncharacterized protein LOC105830233 n=1 Tax=Monomorium pharaonis TaxID=307658 RepID=UPI00063FCF3B|nr:uncharacterized protein LOC105830233 [Monomorium pharaonis]XP_036148947.1 uncharacterized protein LOC105830233 [Monomorium pharaonis]